MTHTVLRRLGRTLAFLGVACLIAFAGCEPAEIRTAHRPATGAVLPREDTSNTATVDKPHVSVPSPNGVSAVIEVHESSFVPPIEIAIDRTADESNVDSSRASSHPHGDQVCASGCKASRHPTPRLSQTDFELFAREFAQQPPDGQCESLDKLVFYGPQSLRYLELRYLAKGPNPLSEAHIRRLESELAVEDLIVQLRVIDERDVIRVALPRTRVPQHVRQEFAMVVQDFQPTITSGTIKRVSVLHAWQRL